MGRIYTRKGDHGQTSLFSGEKVSKADFRVQCYGTLDECQAHLGMARALICDDAFGRLIFSVQQDLSAACAELASSAEAAARLPRHIGETDVARLEAEIDGLVARHGLPAGFIVPGRTPDSAALHVARTVCRRAERLLVGLTAEDDRFATIGVYLNRLSDFLFALAWSAEVVAVVREVADDLLAPRKTSCPKEAG